MEILLAFYVVLEVLLGSVMFCPIVCKLFKKVDIVNDSDDHNPGAFNAIEKCGIKVGMAGLLLDLLKGALPTYLFFRLFPDYVPTFWILLVMIGPVLGHALGIFNKFRGGKCITTSFGVMIGVLPLTYSLFILATLYIGSCFFKKVRDKIKSLVVYSLFIIVSFVLIFVQKETFVYIGNCAISLIVIIKHLMNTDDDYLYKKEKTSC